MLSSSAHTQSHTAQHSLLYSLCHATTPPSIIDYREWRRVLGGGSLCLLSLPWSSRNSSDKAAVHLSSHFPSHLPGTSIWGPIKLYRSRADLMLNGERRKDSTLKWFTGTRHSPLRAALVIELMSKQFITHTRGPLLDAYKEILYVCGIQNSGCDWGQVGWEVISTREES